ncbi:MAG TPA: hypothetical protein VGC09_08235 [Rhodopila sp.]
MTTPSAVDTGSTTARTMHRATGWLTLAASPTFVLLACTTASPITLCASGSSTLPINSMATMYLLMSLFHLSPWLRLASGRPWTHA